MTSAVAPVDDEATMAPLTTTWSYPWDLWAVEPQSTGGSGGGGSGGGSGGNGRSGRKKGHS